MLAEYRRKLAMAKRALDFTTANPLSDTGYNNVITMLTGAVTRGDVLAAQETSGTNDEQSATGQRRLLRRSIRTMEKHLVRVARSVAKSHPDLAGKFVLPPDSVPHKVFITSAKVMLDTANTNKDLLTAAGLGDQLIDNLTQAIAAFDGSTDMAHAGKRDHVGANGELDTVVATCVDAVRILDGLVLILFRPGSEQLSAWQSSRHVAGPFRHSAEPVTPPPAPDPVIPPANGGASNAA